MFQCNKCGKSCTHIKCGENIYCHNCEQDKITKYYEENPVEPKPIFQEHYGDENMSENLREDEKTIEEDLKKVVDLLAMSWLDGARTTFKNWNSWMRGIPEKQLIPHLEKLAKQHSENIIKEVFAKKDGKTE
jgi:uncharacterized Zn finger protein (UPF0148 family)